MATDVFCTAILVRNTKNTLLSMLTFNFDIAINFTGKDLNGYLICNILNAKYRWVKFYLDDDKDVICEMDIKVDESNCGELCVEMAPRMVHIIDGCFDTIVDAKWYEDKYRFFNAKTGGKSLRFFIGSRQEWTWLRRRSVSYPRCFRPDTHSMPGSRS